MLLATSFVFWVGGYLSKPANSSVSMPTLFKKVVIKRTHASILRVTKKQACTLLVHGVRSNRAAMINRSVFFAKHRMTSLLIDLQGHGETLGDNITFGFSESIDVKNGLEYLRTEEHCKKIIAIGQSLGGASILLGSSTDFKADILILESVYPTIEEAINNRLEIHLGKIARVFAPLLYKQIPYRMDISLEQLRPIDALKNIAIPVFIISGTNDLHTKVDESKRMYEAINTKKSLWLVEGAGHEDIFTYSPQQYKENVMSFIKESL
jgi:fermentation-respiration switch protein FrsA (DUF1100 family)